MHKWLTVILALIMAASFLTACQSQGTSQTQPAEQSTPAAAATNQEADTMNGNVKTFPAPPANLKFVTLETSKGIIKFELYPKEAPQSVANFIDLAQKGFYNGLTFHRVEPGFVIQGGDPNGNGTGGPGYNIKDEFNLHKHVLGTVAMARASAPNSAGSQFYICLGPAPFLDQNYTVFGQVVSGIEVVKKIVIGDTIKKVTLSEN